MTKILPITIETKEGDIISPNFPTVLRRFLAQIKTKDGKWELVARRPKRTNPQNAYYWAVVVELIGDIMRDYGNRVNNDTVHEFLKQKFLPGVRVEVLGVEVVKRSTTGLSTKEFTEYLEAIRQYASEVLGVDILDPEEAKQNLLI